MDINQNNFLNLKKLNSELFEKVEISENIVKDLKDD